VSLVRVGLEAAGHYHLPLAGGVLPTDWELRILNPGHVSMQRKVNGQRGVKSDKIDLAAICDLLLAGRGVIAPPFADPVMTLTGWVAHRQRQPLLRRRTIQQLTTISIDASPGSAQRCGPSCSPRLAGSSSASSPTRPGSPDWARHACGPSPPTAVCE